MLLLQNNDWNAYNLQRIEHNTRKGGNCYSLRASFMNYYYRMYRLSCDKLTNLIWPLILRCASPQTHTMSIILITSSSTIAIIPALRDRRGCCGFFMVSAFFSKTLRSYTAGNRTSTIPTPSQQAMHNNKGNFLGECKGHHMTPGILARSSIKLEGHFLITVC